MSKKSKRNRRPEREARQNRTVIDRWWKAVPAIALTIVVCLLAYGSSIQFGLTGLDDDMLVSNFAKNQYHILDAFSRDAFMIEKGDTFYRPLQSLVFMADTYIWGSSPVSIHRTNIILHCLAVCCLLQLLILLGYPQSLSLLATLVYAANPLFAQAVAWIPGCGDLLLGLFGILSFYSLVKFRTNERPRHLILHFLTLLLAAFSKETALVLPLLFAAYLLLVEKKKAFRIRNLSLAAVWLVAFVAYFFMRKGAMYGIPDSRTFGIGRLMEHLRVLPETVAGFVIPFNISVLPSFTLRLTLTGLAVIAVIAIAIWFQKKQSRPMVIVGWLWFILLSIPGMMYNFKLGSYGYDYLNHRAYLPMVGILLVFVEAIPDAWLVRRREQFHAVGGIAVALLCILAYRQSTSFASMQAFYDQAVQTNPKSALAFNHRGKFKAETGNFRSALADYDKALKLYPNFPFAYTNRAEARGSLGDVRGAMDDLNKAISLEPGNAALYNNRGRWNAVLGNNDAALADYNRGIMLDPHFAPTYSNRGAWKATAGDEKGAIADFEAALERDPMFLDAMYNLGLLRIKQGDRSGACNEWFKAARLQHGRARDLAQKYCR